MTERIQSFNSPLSCTNLYTLKGNYVFVITSNFYDGGANRDQTGN